MMWGVVRISVRALTQGMSHARLRGRLGNPPRGVGENWLKVHAEGGRKIGAAEVDVPEEKWPFVRAGVANDKGQNVWTNPIRV